MGLLSRLTKALSGGPSRALIAGKGALLRDLAHDVLDEEGWEVVSSSSPDAPVSLIVFFSLGIPVEEGSAAPLDPAAEEFAPIRAAGDTARVLLVAPVQTPLDVLAKLAEVTRASGWLGAPFTRDELIDEVRRCMALTKEEAAAFRSGLR